MRTSITAFWLAIALLIQSHPATAEAPPPPIDLPIPHIRQLTPVWCWAAVSQMLIGRMKGPAATPPQCALVAGVYGEAASTCCAGAGNPACVVPGSIPQIQNLIAYFGGRYSVTAPPTGPMVLYQQLSAGRPIVLQIAMSPSMAHVIVLKGMYFADSSAGPVAMLIVNDPMEFGTTAVPFSAIASKWMSAIVVL